MRSAFLLLAFTACAPDLRDEFPFDGALPGADHITHVAQADGSTLSLVDATNKTSYVYFDLDTGKELEGAVAVETQAWDLSFQRFKITSNGGTGGPGPVRVAVVKGGDFDATIKAPADGYAQDATDTVINGTEGGWYTYDLGAHRLVTRDDLFYVVATDAAFFKLRKKSYYDQGGTPARMTFWWAPVAAP